MRYSRDQLLEIQPSTPNFELVNRLRELRLGVGLPRKRGCRGGRKKLRSIQVVPSRNLHPLMVPPFLQPHPDLQSAVGNAPLSSKHSTHLPTTDCLLSITPLMGGQPSDAPALSPPSPLQQGGQSSNAPALSPPSPLPQGSQPIALALSPSSPLPQDGQPSDAPGLSPSSSTLLLCPSDSTLSICHLNSQSAVKTVLSAVLNATTRSGQRWEDEMAILLWIAEAQAHHGPLQMRRRSDAPTGHTCVKADPERRVDCASMTPAVRPVPAPWRANDTSLLKILLLHRSITIQETPMFPTLPNLSSTSRILGESLKSHGSPLSLFLSLPSGLCQALL
ncbi:hypothetical protein ACOMHN_030305 [Nucella lapillus]